MQYIQSSAQTYHVNNGLLIPQETLFVCVDIQTKLLGAMSYKERVLKNARTLLQGAKILNIPILITEQYPKGLGSTDESLGFKEFLIANNHSSDSNHNSPSQNLESSLNPNANSLDSRTNLDSRNLDSQAPNPQISNLKNPRATHLEIPQCTLMKKTSFSIFGDKSIADFIRQSKRTTLVFFGIETHVCVLQSVWHSVTLGLDVWVAEDALSSRNSDNHDNAIWLMRQKGAKITNTESILFGAMKDSKHPSFKAISALIK